jgi:hypothetical protein
MGLLYSYAEVLIKRAVVCANVWTGATPSVGPRAGGTDRMHDQIYMPRVPQGKVELRVGIKS